MVSSWCKFYIAAEKNGVGLDNDIDESLQMQFSYRFSIVMDWIMSSLHRQKAFEYIFQMEKQHNS